MVSFRVPSPPQQTTMSTSCPHFCAARVAAPVPVVMIVFISKPASLNCSRMSGSTRLARFCPAKGFIMNSIFFMDFSIILSRTLYHFPG